MYYSDLTDEQILKKVEPLREYRKAVLSGNTAKANRMIEGGKDARYMGVWALGQFFGKVKEHFSKHSGRNPVVFGQAKKIAKTHYDPRYLEAIKPLRFKEAEKVPVAKIQPIKEATRKYKYVSEEKPKSKAPLKKEVQPLKKEAKAKITNNKSIGVASNNDIGMKKVLTYSGAVLGGVLVLSLFND